MEEELSFSVSQNRPNPFVESTMIDFTLPKAAEVTLEVYNTHGKRCLTQFVKGTQGQNQLWITKKDLGAAGVYLYTLKTPFGSRSKKLIMQ